MPNHPGRAAASHPSPEPEDIRAFLVERQMTQAALAQSVKVTGRTVERWLSGQQSMPPGLWELAQIKGLVKL